MLKKVVDIAHDILLEGMDEQSIAVDFTCGGGHDSLFLSQHALYVHSYDIQKEALDDAKKLCHLAKNISFHHKSHLYFDEDVERFDRGIFNLGYYPKGDRSITTQAHEVLEAIKKHLISLTMAVRSSLSAIRDLKAVSWKPSRLKKHLLVLKAGGMMFIALAC